MRFSKKDLSNKCNQKSLETADLVTFTGEILNGILQFLFNGGRYSIASIALFSANLITYFFSVDSI